MGLDTTHNAWHGPYSSFNKFRYSLAAQIGINLDDYAGYRGNGEKDLADIKHDLQPLFDHSDCDGILTIDEQKKIVSGLEEVFLKLDKKNLPYPEFEKDILQFHSGCLLAISKNEPIEFH